MGDKTFFLEFKKLKRTYFFWVMAAAGAVGSLYSYMFFTIQRTKIMNGGASQTRMLLTQTYGLLAFVNLFAIIIGACTLFHVEYDSNGIKRLVSLPIRIQQVFINKAVLLTFYIVIITAMEGIGLFVTAFQYIKGEAFAGEILCFLVKVFILSLPSAYLMLFISSLCKNMWLTIGFGVAGLFSGLLYGGISSVNIYVVNPFAAIFYPAVKMATNIPAWVFVCTVIESILILTICCNIMKRKEWVS